jgi:hypothetical protein
MFLTFFDAPISPKFLVTTGKVQIKILTKQLSYIKQLATPRHTTTHCNKINLVY